MACRDVSLNIVLTYPVKWNAYSILRDYVQNFYDAVQPDEWKEAFRYSYDGEERRLIMEVDRNGFSYEWLMHIGASSKTNSEEPHAGYFGEGFKIASLCAIRDFRWGIKMLSRDWEVTVETMVQELDGQMISVLAYHIEDGKPEMEGSRLEIDNITASFYLIFLDAYRSFYYPEHELYGREICRTDTFAVYERSDVPAPSNIPITEGMEGRGIVYCGFQMMGTVPFPLVLCLHQYDGIERDRNTLLPFQVIDVTLKIACQMPPDAAIDMLERLKRYWYRYPKKKKEISVTEWSPVINALIRRIRLSEEATESFCRKYPNLLCAARPEGKKEQRLRHQALIWKRQKGGKYRLVKDVFSLLGYDFLEEACRKNGGFSDHIRKPNETESAGAGLMELLTRELYGDFFGTVDAWPEIWITDHREVVYLEWGEYERRKEKKKNNKGLELRYRIDRLVLDRDVFRQESFPRAFSDYIHELCHVFGKDASERCSNAMTIAMEMMLTHREKILTASERWNRIMKEIAEIKDTKV